MPRQTSTISTEGMPLWDTFEASFFVGAGLSVGLVLGILFPSLWRTFRRGFRKSSHYAPQKEKLEPKVESKLKILHTQNDNNSEESDELTLKELPIQKLRIIEGFVLARNCFQIGDARNAVKMYVSLLTHESISKQETNRALYELSQVYLSIGLYARAYETALELFNRKPTLSEILLHIIHICTVSQTPEKVIKALHVYKGSPDKKLRLSIAHSFCQIGENFLEKAMLHEAIENARQALHYERLCARALILLWIATSTDLWQKVGSDPKLMWTALATDLETLLQIFKSTDVSPYAPTAQLAKSISKLSQSKELVECFPSIEKEFTLAIQKEKFDENTQKILWASIFHATLLIEDEPELKNSEFLHEILAILGKHQESYLSISKQKKASRIGYSLHKCLKCNSFFASFAWQCAFCSTEESLRPIVYPEPFFTKEENSTQSRIAKA